jgi:hypothetical protein
MENAVGFASALSAVIGALILCADIYIDRQYRNSPGKSKNNRFTVKYLGYLAIAVFMLVFSVALFTSDRIHHFFDLVIIDYVAFLMVVLLAGVPIVFLNNKFLVSRIQNRTLQGIASLLGGIAASTLTVFVTAIVLVGSGVDK